MLKKLPLLLIVLLLLSLSLPSFAMNRTQPDRERREKIQSIFLASQTIYSNRLQIKQMNDELRIELRESKSKIKQLIKNKVQLSESQILTIKNVLTLISESQDILELPVNTIKLYDATLHTAREAKDFDAILVIYDEILAIQKHRIQQLKILHEAFESLALIE